jgi:hypothetical protein
LATKRTSHTGGLELFIDDFDDNDQLEEFIYFGSSNDLLGLHGDTKHLACYSFEGGLPEELWYLETPLTSVAYVYRPRHVLAGMWGAGRVALVDYWRGTWCDTVQLDHNLGGGVFFETDTPSPQLNFVGRLGDTVYVYQFDIPTDVDEPDEPEILPSDFTLAQNYPNPFNGETVISFANPSRQHLSLTIFNVLGQRVNTLLDGVVSPGEHTVTWNGRDDSGQTVATGVYFARLKAGDQSRLIKMVYAK